MTDEQCSTNGRPNFVLIVSDDMGYSDLPLYGGRNIPTPHLDRLGRQGVVFTDGYSTAPVCTPSRIGIFTGRYQQRYGIYDLYGHRDDFPLFNAPSVRSNTLAAHLKAAGYATALVGKWHMGSLHCISGNDPGHPLEFGFDEYLGISCGMSSYFPGATLYRNREAFPAPEYLTDFFGKEACAFIERKKDDPFFLMLAFNAVHAPLEAEQSDIDLMDTGGEFPGSPDRKTYAAMLANMDRNIGRVLDKLTELGLDDNTYIGFINDNGGGGNDLPAHTRNTAVNAPLRGFKFDVYEGGIRVPMLLKGPGIPANIRCNKMVSGLDFAPTFLRVAGIKTEEGAFDGIDLRPIVSGNAAETERTLFWKNGRWSGPFQACEADGTYNLALRKGNWKLVRYGVIHDNAATAAPWELFNLDHDIGEQHNLAPEYPDLVARLADEYWDWQDQMPPKQRKYRKKD